MKKYVIALLTLIILSVSFAGLYALIDSFILENDMQIISKLQLAFFVTFGIMAIERGKKPSEYGDKESVKILLFLSIFVIIFCIITGKYLNPPLKSLNIILLCILIPVLGFIIYFCFRYFFNKKINTD